MKRVLLTLLLSALAAAGSASPARYTVVTVDTSEDQLQLFWGDAAGKPFRGFAPLNAWLAQQGRELVFATNAGMYHPDFSPVGLLVIEGREVSPLNLGKARGNFFLKPNGVFLVGPDGPQVVASSEYPALARGVRIATQSGPLLLRHGRIHPAFKKDSRSRHIRNGVGVVGNKAIFVISDDPVTFHEFALFMRDELGCRDALYLDGSISSLYDKEQGRQDLRGLLGPMIAITAPLGAQVIR
ncbi:phosphodiester glycosidase family protein [Massilia sp. PAMC28688]|uniref:phosphodiester glycosidase family protein n=1 Tax=Massilia sp. PAMC28688 TaxID=2861283 RepID=UPI001C63A3B8|nr:phosphodiester glycosidase family protein [Massilia sp. PAMC28688]QYF92047.1 phosphodiester glycosidase family protein [Massilia sp. PAMC28688]